MTNFSVINYTPALRKLCTLRLSDFKTTLELADALDALNRGFDIVMRELRKIEADMGRDGGIDEKTALFDADSGIDIDIITVRRSAFASELPTADIVCALRGLVEFKV